MEPTHIKSEDVEVNDFGVIQVQDLLNAPGYEDFSVAKVILTGEQKFGSNPECDVAYFVLEGEGTFFFEDKEFSVKKGDLVFIPKNTKYKDSGDVTLLAISSPRYDGEKRESIEKD
jgi:mannose-6-phosphate isomerase-like protein (cupin superfamily)